MAGATMDVPWLKRIQSQGILAYYGGLPAHL